MHNTTLVLPIAILLSACATPQPGVPSAASAAPKVKLEASDATDGCSVYVYRNKTSFHRFNPEKPFVYVDEERVGKLGVGDSICLKMAAGKYTVSIKAPIAFMPTYTVGKVDIEVLADTPIYVRYSKDFSGVVVSGATATATGSSTMQVVTETHWRDRL